MANIKLGAMVADARGAIGGVVFSRGGGGAIARTNVKPVNPRSSGQQARRALLAYLSQYWSSTLTDTFRANWRTYAAQTSWTNKVGTAAVISGLAAFVRLNTLLKTAGFALQSDAPFTTGHAGTPSFTILANPTGESVSIAEPSAPFDKTTGSARMLWFIHAATNAGRARPSGTKRYIGESHGDPNSPAVFPKVITSPYAYSPGQIVTVTGIYIDPNGRIGVDYSASVVAAVP